MQREDKTQSVQCDINDDAGVSTASCSIPPQPPKLTQSSIRQFLQKSVTPPRQKNKDLAKMTALDFQPFSVVGDKGFRKFIHALNPMYAIPSRKTLSQKIIPSLYDRDHAFPFCFAYFNLYFIVLWFVVFCVVSL